MLELSLLLFLQRKGSPNQMAPNISVIKQARLHTSGHLSLIQTAGFTQNKTQNTLTLKAGRSALPENSTRLFTTESMAKLRSCPLKKKIQWFKTWGCYAVITPSSLQGILSGLWKGKWHL